MERLIVAIDGPSGAGKSTVAMRLAEELDYTYIETGAMYRAFALKVLRSGVDLSGEKAMEKVLEDTKIELRETQGHPRVVLDGRDVTEEIYTPELSQMASKISGARRVRERMVELQREMGLQGGVVVEGRDIGTVVFPDADVKIFLDASPRERARRRFRELVDRGSRVSLEETLEELEARDRRDQERDVAPLRRAQDAILIDSTSRGIEDVVDQIVQEVKKNIAKSNNDWRTGS